MKKLLYILLIVPLALFGQDNYSLNFDYIDDYVLLESNSTLDIDTISNVISISAYFQANEIELSELAGRMEESGPDGYRVNLRNNGDIWAQFGTYGSGETAIANNGYSVGEWIYVTAIFKNHEYVKIYTNGILKDSVSTNRSFGAFNTNLTIGRGSLNFNPMGNFELFSGYLDRIEQWNRELSVNEIQLYMTCAPIGDEEGLVGYWNFNEGTGDIVYDLSGNGNHGVINGATYSEDVPEQNCNELEGVNEELEEFSNLNQIDGFAYGGFLDGSYYFVSDEAYSWMTADSISNLLGGHLVTITSQDESDYISSLITYYDSINNDNRNYFIGLFQNQESDLYEEPNGGWEWVTGEPISYTDWRNNEPNEASPGENFATLINGSSNYWEQDEYEYEGWNDAHQGGVIINGVLQGTVTNFILEIDAIYGCLDSDYYNYNPQANTSDDSCMMYEEFLIDSLRQALSVFETVEEEQDYSMSFDGVDDFVTFSFYEELYNTNTFTWSFNFNLNQYLYESGTIPMHTPLLNYSYGYNLDGFNISYGFWSENFEPPYYIWYGEGENNQMIQSYSNINLVNLNEWNNLAITKELNSVNIYLNGVNVTANSQDFNNIIINNQAELVLGAFFDDPNICNICPNSTFLNGFIDDLALFENSLSNQQIQSYMSCPPTGQEEGLVGYWNFNEGSGDTVYDISGNGNHGIIYGGAEFSEDVPEIFSGCVDENALNFDESALCDNGSCVYGDDVLSNLEESFNQTVSGLNNDLDSTNSTLNEVIDTWQSSIDLTNATLDEVSDMNQTIASFTTLIDLQEGWNMIGYGCPEPVNIEQGMSMYTDLVLLIKDNNGSVYLPEFNFNGIGDFTPGYGYQLKVSEPIEDFGLCGDYTNTESPEITDIETDNAQMQNDINCLTGNPEIGDYCYGGIVFYVEEGEEGKYGLVAALEDLPESYRWGCYEMEIFGADGHSIGTGLQNTIDLVSGCTESPIAASEALAYEFGGYSDWCLPSKEELLEIYNTIGQGSGTGNIGDFSDDWYWSSTKDNNASAWGLIFTDGFSGNANQNGFHSVRPIRSFGNWTMGCMDSLACNYHSEANMADASCSYPEEGYDCDGNIQTSLSFDGINDYLYFSDSLTLTNYSFSGWINLNNSDAYSPIFFLGADGSSSIEIYVQPNSNGLYNKLTVAHNRNLDCANGYKYFSSLTSYYNSWMFLTVTFDNGIVKAYYNGIEQIITQGEGVLGDPNCVTNHNIFLGMQNSFEQIFLHGNIDNFAFWDRVLSQHEITNLMDCSPTGNEENLVGYWNFNEIEGDTIYNITGNGNHGTINGAVYSTDVPYTDCE